MSREVLNDFDNGHGLTDSQKNTLGIWVPDPSDGDWCYGQFYGNGAYNTGCLVRHATSNDLVGSATGGTVTEPIPIGADYLADTGEFASSDVRGAIGYIYDGAGAGQTFYVRRMIPGDNDRVEIVLLSSPTARPRTTGWAVALAGTSLYRMWLPGRFYLSSNNQNLDAGLVQTTLTVTADFKPFGWVKCSGRGAGRLYDGFTGLTASNPYVIPHADGELNGGGAPSAIHLRDAVGRVTMPVPTVANVTLLAEIALSIVNRGPSYSLEGEGHSGNTVNIV